MDRDRQLHQDLVEADVAAGFALLRLSVARFMSGAPQEAWRALDEADVACSDGQQRLARLADADAQRFRPELERLRGEIDRTRWRLRPGP